MNQKIFVRSHCNLYYQRSLRQLFEIDYINFWKKWVYRIKSSKGFLGKNLRLCWAHRNTYTYHQQCSIKTKGCVITLLDLKNAFGEVNHQLLIDTVKLHHVPDDVISLIFPPSPIMIFQFSRTHSWLHRLEFIEVFYKMTAYLPYFLILS